MYCATFMFIGLFVNWRLYTVVSGWFCAAGLVVNLLGLSKVLLVGFRLLGWLLFCWITGMWVFAGWLLLLVWFGC